jgi:DNA-binding transcriptional ArsR family regulator
MRRDVFQAIADPNRRAILDLLARQPMTLNGVAQHFTISRPAISKHVKILTECGLVEIHPQGRERYCEARPERLDQISEWLERYRKLWEGRFDRLDEYLKDLQAEEKPES